MSSVQDCSGEGQAVGNLASEVDLPNLSLPQQGTPENGRGRRAYPGTYGNLLVEGGKRRESKSHLTDGAVGADAPALAPAVCGDMW